jgi:hypothetical protein
MTMGFSCLITSTWGTQFRTRNQKPKRIESDVRAGTATVEVDAQQECISRYAQADVNFWER